MSNTIQIPECDNEMIIIAYKYVDETHTNQCSFELCRILSGNGSDVNVTINTEVGQYQGSLFLNGINCPLSGTYNVSLDAGDYQIAAVGINWGVSMGFTMSVNGMGVPFLGISDQGASQGIVQYTAPVPITQ
jgi:hypothetical protein